MDALLKRLEQRGFEQGWLTANSTALVAVSGGVDSMVLLHALSTLAASVGMKLVVAHFNHQLRGAAADADERFVKRVARELRLRSVMGRADVAAWSRRKRVSVEMAARELRHRFFCRAANRVGAQRVFLAHHADDQLELFILRVLRGAGPDGLSGMAPVSPSPFDPKVELVRPFLSESKLTIVAFARERRIAFREDLSNRSSDFPRNRVRNEILPALQSLQPGLERNVLRTMELLRDESAFVAQQTKAYLDGQKRKPFGSLAVALQRRVLCARLLEHGIVPQFEHVEALRRSTAWVTLAPDLQCRRNASGELECRKPKPERRITETWLCDVSRIGCVECNSVHVSWKISKGRQRLERRPMEESFDADAVGRTVTIRHWRPGDRFQPIGMGQSVKLQDFFVNQKIPRELRHQLLVAQNADGEIFWVEGQRIGERFKITPLTRRTLRWSWQRGE